ncbi:ThuA domain-containing protein [Herbiconiux sp. UC225_62]|uniref:ThuA domain-containing protein n=1 Tax=Herbiconiux sp. UC225_62 TaxID=3350168 RepID=UPI0036D2908A
MTEPRRAVIAVGHGRYADPWHPYDAVAERMRELLDDDGWSVRVDPDVDGAMTRLDDADLLVVVAGDPWGQGERAFGAPAASVAGLGRALDRALGVLAMHSSSATLRDYPVWAEALGGIWVPEASMHPPFDDAAQVHVLPHPVTAGLGDFVVADERYCHLQGVGARTVLAEHVEAGERQPLVWLREFGVARIAYDALGHDERSYESASHREIIRRLARWAAGA